MTTFDERERAFESKFAHDEEMRFRVNARRMKLVGLWAAGLMGRTDAAAEAYAIEVVKADFAEVGYEDVVRKIAADLGGRATVEEVRAKIDAMLPVAQEQLMGESG